jgi:hypothetical protein
MLAGMVEPRVAKFALFTAIVLSIGIVIGHYLF